MNYQTQFKSYLQSKGMSLSTILHYQLHATKFMQYTNKEALQVNKSDVLNYLNYLQQKGFQNSSRAGYLNAIRHYFTCLQKQNIITQNPCSLLKLRGVKQKKLHRTFIVEELTQIFDNYYTHYIESPEQSTLSKQRNAAMLSILLNQGTTTREIDTIQSEDLNLIKATIKIRGGRRSNSRAIPLKAEQIGILMHYLQNTRPQLVALSAIKNNKLFLPLPEQVNKPTTTDNLMNTFRDLTKQVKQIEPSFTNFKQTRASVITHWLKTEGLRKTQYLAGHRNISSTEEYQPNNIEELSKDIKTLHPYQ